jgi:hypothetical protein
VTRRKPQPLPGQGAPKKETVAVGFLHPSLSISPQFSRSKTMVMMRDAMQGRRITSEYDQESSANISQGRCELVRRFLSDPNRPDWLWMVDSDMTFGDGILDRLMESADRKDRPILGGLCFGVRPMKDDDGMEIRSEVGASPLELFPTIYTLDDDGRMLHWQGYPAGEVVQVHSTGAACLLIHRRVLSDDRWAADGHPLPWFRETVLHGEVCSEDHFFCLKAGSLGFPVHVDCGARTGHVKTFVADEQMFLAQHAVFAEMEGHPDE